MEGAVALEDPQAAFLILKHCASFCKLIFFIRTCPPDQLSDATSEFDMLCLRTLERIIGFPLNNLATKCAQLDIPKGGLGLRSTYLHRTAAYTASFNMCRKMVTNLTGTRPSESHLQRAHASTVTLIGKSTALETNSNSQHCLSAVIEEANYEQFKARLAEEPAAARHLANLTTNSSLHSGDFLLALPIPSLNLHMRPAEWRIAAARRIGIELAPSSTICPSCGKQNLDKWGDHALMCDTGNDRIARHNKIVRVLGDIATRAGLNPIIEPKNLASENQRPDICLPHFTSGKEAIIDVAITCPLQSKYIDQTGTLQLHAANNYATTIKTPKYSPSASKSNLNFIPFVVETSGGWCSEAADALEHMAWLTAGRNECLASTSRSQIHQALSVALHAANSRTIFFFGGGGL